MSTERRPLRIMFLTIFIDLLGVGILIPVIPQLLGNPASPQYLLPDSLTTQEGYVLFGFLLAMYPLAQFFSTPILGQLSDRIGRRPVLVVSMAGTAIGYAIFALGIHLASIPLLFASRILDGITGGNLSVAQAVIADITPPDQRSKHFGFVGAIFGLGFILGPAIGGQLADSSIHPLFTAATPFWFATVLSAFNTLLIWLFLKETNKHRVAATIEWTRSISNIIRAFSLPALRPLFLVGFLFQSGFSFFTSFFGIYLIVRFGFDESDIGYFFAYIGICVALTQVFLTPFVARRWKEQRVLSVSLAATGVVVFLFLQPGPWPLLLAIVPFFSVCNGLSQANFMGLLSRLAGAQVQGEVLGINASLGALSQAIPAILSGVIAAGSAPSVPLLIAGLVMIAGGIAFRSSLGARRAPSS